MFRIKTDIRQYRCESRDRVERLIRNWVIRPSDLIWDDAADDWQPIGDHPAFVELFDTLSEQHENQPETVVTDSVADKAATDRMVAKNEGALAGPEAATAVIERSDSRPPAKNTERPARATVAGRQADSEADSDSDSSDDSEQTPIPPEPSDDVVGVYRDSDEITLMTDRTLALLIEQRGDTSVAIETEPPEDFARAAPDEPTGLLQRPDFEDEDPPERPSPPPDSARVEVAAEEPTNRIQRPEFDDRPTPEAAGPSTPDEPTDRIEKPDFNDPPRPDRSPRHDEPAEQKTGAEQPSDTEDSDDSTGRHNLPEQLFITAEIEEEDDEDDSPQSDAVLTSVDQSVLDGELPTDPADENDGERIDPDSPDTKTPVTEPTDADTPKQQPSPDGQPVASGETTDGETTGDEPEELPIVDVEPVEAETDSGADPEDEDAQPLPEIDVSPVDDGVSAGYDVDFLIPIEPSEESVQLGIQRSSASKWKQSLLYSTPEPKSPGDVVTRSYDLDRSSRFRLPLPVSREVAIAVGVAVAVVLVVVLFAVIR